MCVVCVCGKPVKSPAKPRGFAEHSLNTSVVEYDTTESERFLPSLRMNQNASICCNCKLCVCILGLAKLQKAELGTIDR